MTGFLGNVDGLKNYRSFEDLTKDDLIPFSIAPVYAYSGVNGSLIEAFMEDRTQRKPKEIRAGRIMFDVPVVTYCQEHGVFIDVMDKDSFLYFKQWLLSQEFIDRINKKYFEVRHWLVRCLDPIALKLQVRMPASFELFTLSGVKGLMRPNKPIARIRDGKDPAGFVMLEVIPPEEQVIVRARAAFQVLKEGL